MAAVVFAASTLAFVILHLAPGDAANALAEGVPAAVRERLRVRYGLDQPIGVQYLRWIGALLQGDLGWSLSQQRPVRDVLASRLPATLALVLPAFTISVLAGMAVGAWQAVHAQRRRDRLTSLALLVVYSVPEFWLGLALVLLFARTWHWLPANGMTGEMSAYLPLAAQLRDRLVHIVLPTTALAAVGVATFARYQRSSMQEALRQRFVQTAAASGLPRHRVLFVAWRSALLPVVSVGGLLLPSYLAGVVFIEQVFAWPGMGSMLVQAVAARDYPLVGGAVVVGSAITAAGAALAEWLRDRVDPRVADARSVARGDGDAAGRIPRGAAA